MSPDFCRNVICLFMFTPVIVGGWVAADWCLYESNHPVLFLIVAAALICGMAYLIGRPKQPAERH